MSTDALGWIRSLLVLAALSGASTMAVAAEPPKPAAVVAGPQALSLLSGKLRFVLQGYEPRPMPGGRSGTLFYNKETNRVVIVGEEPLPATARDSSARDFLDSMKVIKAKQQAASADYQVTREQTERVQGLDVHRIDATDDINGNKVLQTTLLAVGAQTFIVIQVMSSVKDTAGHATAVDNILGK